MKFEKVSFGEFKRSLEREGLYFDYEVCKKFYDQITLPVRSTEFSAGYDFYSPVPFYIHPGDFKNIPSGIKCCFDGDERKMWHLKLYIRSSVGIKNHIILSNGTGVIDADYYGNKENEGNIMIPLHSIGGIAKRFEAGERIAQGIFEMYGKTLNDESTGVRIGGVGSTGD